MAHRSQQEFIKLVIANYQPTLDGLRVLEIGSLDINGSIRCLFPGTEYIGLDVAEGKGVDVVCQGQEYDAPDNSFDIVLSCEAMEHNPFWKETMQNMIRLCKPGGLVVMTCATTGRPEHGTTRTRPQSSPLTVGLGWDYYRNLEKKDLTRAIDFDADCMAHRFWVNWNHFDLLFLGVKTPDQKHPVDHSAWAGLENAVDQWLAAESGSRVHRYRSAMARTLGDRWFAAMNRLGANLGWLHEPR